MAMNNVLTIGVDATTWWNRRGFGRFIRGQLGAMIADPGGHRFVLFVDREPADVREKGCAQRGRVFEAIEDVAPDGDVPRDPLSLRPPFNG